MCKISLIKYHMFDARIAMPLLGLVLVTQWHGLVHPCCSILGPYWHSKEGKGEGEPERKRKREGREREEGREKEGEGQ